MTHINKNQAPPIIFMASFLIYTMIRMSSSLSTSVKSCPEKYSRLDAQLALRIDGISDGCLNMRPVLLKASLSLSVSC